MSALAGSFCGLLFGYDIGAISSATRELRVDFALSAPALGIAVSAALFGTIAGSVVAGFVADVIDRRGTLLVSGLLYVIASLGAAFASGFEQFVIFRIVGGIAIGLISVATPMYLAEIAPARLRGRMVGSFQINVSIGVVLGFALGYFFSIYSKNGEAWRYTLACGVVPALFCEALLLKAAPSPRWLALRGRFAEARDAMADLGSTDPAADQGRLAASVEEFGALRQSKLFSRRYARPLLLAASIAIFNQLTGVNVLLYYILDVFTELGSDHLNGRKDAILVAGFSLLVTTVAVSVIDKVGRKPLLLAGAAGTVVWVYLSEIFPLPVRARGQSFGSSVHWVANAFIVGSFPAIASNLGRKIFVALAVLMAIQFFVVLFVYPETKRTSLESLASDVSC